jgi:hypothetical protein
VEWRINKRALLDETPCGLMNGVHAMKRKLWNTTITALLLMLFPHIATAVDRDCDLPQDLQAKISHNYPGKKIVSLSDLDEGDRTLFQKDHGNACPGIVNVDFYGDGKPTFALVLIGKDGGKTNADLIIAHRPGQSWNTKLLDTAKDSVPVVWKQGPGKYQDVYGKKKVVAVKPVVVFCEYEAWAILYAWMDNRAAKIWLSD